LAWQDFKAQNKQARKGGSVAPNLPMKRSDRLGTGLKSIEEERKLENEIRKESGKALSKSIQVYLGRGYRIVNDRYSFASQHYLFSFYVVVS